MPLKGSESLVKDSLPARYRSEVGHGRLCAAAILDFKPDVVLSANTPLEAQRQVLRAARAVDAAFAYWMQDVLSLAMARILPKKLPVAGHALARYYTRLERQMLLRSDWVIAISPEFEQLLHRWGASKSRTHVVPNWAPTLRKAKHEELEAWRQQNDLQGRRILMYSGTLGMKHSPSILLDIAQALEEVPDTCLVVIGDGAGVKWLKEHAAKVRQDRLRLLPFQPPELMPVSLGSAEVLLALLHSDAGDYCVPSKVLTYMQAGKPILGAMPQSNPASRMINEHGFGYVVDPDDAKGLVENAKRLLLNREQSAEMGLRAERYAQANFSSGQIAVMFEKMLLHTRDLHGRGSKDQGSAKPQFDLESRTTEVR
jgi:glycosyltransferase involved in cell wall biosynthesis